MNRNIFLILIVFALISSCTVYKEYPIDIYQPGEVSVPPDAKNVALVYRNFKYEGDTLLHYYKDDHKIRKAKRDPENLDSILINICLQELAANLKANNTFNRIHIFPELFKPHKGKKLPVLNLEMVENVTNSTETDLLISLETFSVFFSEFSKQFNETESNEVVTAAVWAVYDPKSKKLLDRKTMIDTLYWNKYDEQGNYLSKAKIPPRLSALKIASQMAGENYSKRFFASWQTVNRMYSIPPLPDFSEAAYFIDEGKWDNAILLWKRYADKRNGKMAINARYNLALGYEMKDDLQTARKWIIAARQLATEYRSKEDLKMILKYEKVLNKRIKDLQKLNVNSNESSS